MGIKLTKLLQSWQVFHAVKEELGLEYLYKMWGYRNARHIQRWCCDPRKNVEVSPNPLDKLQVMLEDLARLGHKDIAIAAVKILARPLGLEVKELNLQPSKNIISEFLDIPQIFGEVSKLFQEVIADNKLTEEEILLLEEEIDRLIKEALEFKKALKTKVNEMEEDASFEVY